MAWIRYREKRGALNSGGMASMKKAASAGRKQLKNKSIRK